VFQVKLLLITWDITINDVSTGSNAKRTAICLADKAPVGGLDYES